MANVTAMFFRTQEQQTFPFRAINVMLLFLRACPRRRVMLLSHAQVSLCKAEFQKAASFLDTARPTTIVAVRKEFMSRYIRAMLRLAALRDMVAASGQQAALRDMAAASGQQAALAPTGAENSAAAPGQAPIPPSAASGQLAVTVAMAEALAQVVSEADGVKKWLAQNVALFLEVQAHWANRDISSEAAVLVRVCDQVHHAMVDAWAQALAAAEKALAAIMPSRGLLESAMLMADASLQAALRSAVVAVRDSRLMAILSEMRAAGKRYDELSVSPLPKAMFAKALGTRRFCRLAMCVDYAVAEMATFSPESPADLAGQSARVKKEIARKGVRVQDLPMHLQRFFDRMERKSLEVGDTASGQNPAAVAASG